MSESVTDPVFGSNETGEERGDKTEDLSHGRNKTRHSTKKEPPDGGWGWFIVLACSMAFFLISGTEKSYGLVFLELREQYDSSSSMTAFVPSLTAGLRLFLGPLGSALGTKFGCRPVVMVGGCLYLVSFLGSIAPPNLYYLYFSYGLLSGVAGALTQSNCIIMVGYYFRKKMSTANGLATAGGGIGIFVFNLLVQFLLENYGYSGYILISAGLVFNIVVCGALLRPLEESRRWCTLTCDCLGNSRLCASCTRSVNDENEVEPAGGVVDAFAYYNSNESIVLAAESREIARQIESKDGKIDKPKKTQLLHWSLLKDPTFLLVAFSILFTSMGNLLAFILLPALAIEKNLTTSQGAFLVSIIGITDLVGRLTIGVVSDIPCIRPHRRHVFLGANLLMGMFLELFPLGNQYHEFAVLAALYGFVEGMVLSHRNVIMMDLLGVEKYPSCIGFAHMFGGLGLLIGPILGGAIKDTLGNYTYSFAFAGAFIMLGALCFMAEFFWSKYFKPPPRALMQETVVTDESVHSWGTQDF